MMSPAHLRMLLWLLTAALCGFGLVMVASTTSGFSSAESGPTAAYVIRQGAAMVLGLLVALGLSWFGPERLRHPAVIVLAVVGTIGALLVARHLMAPVNGAWRWIRVGPLQVQPAELAKLALILVGAWYLVRVEEKVRVHWHGVLLPLVGFGMIALLVYMTRDLGSVVVMAGILWVMLFYAGANWLFTTVIGIGCAPLVLYLAVFQTGYRRDRILAFLDPMDASNPAAWHLKQSFIAIGSGEVEGVGLGESMSRFAFLPERHTDFIYAVICEELGFIGGFVIAGLFLALVWTGLAIANRTRDRHSRLLAVGVTVLIGIQAFWNMLVVTGTVPTKGLTLPFISYGGSSILVCLAGIGLLDAVARRCPEPEQLPGHATTRIGAVAITRRSETEGAL